MTTSVQEYGRQVPRRLSLLRVGAATSLTAVVFMLLCWVGAAVGFGPASHMYIALFSDFAVTSAAALVAGLCWSLVGGFVAGAAFAAIYNLLGAIER